MTSGIGRRRAAAQHKGSPEYQARRLEIARAAARVFDERGYEATSMAAVAEAAGVDRASLYYYISGKEELYDEVVREVSEANVARAEAVRAMELPGDVKLRRLVVDLMHSYSENHPLLYVYIRENLAQVDEERREWADMMRGLNRRYDRAVIGVVEDGYADGTLRDVGPPRLVAYGLIGMMAWTNRWYRPGVGDHDAAEIGTTFANMVLAGLGLAEG